MLPDEYSVQGKSVIITGAARGIGKGIARVLAEAGANVMVTALTDRYLKPLAEEMAASGHPIETLTADATKAEEWRKTVDAAMEKWGRIDVLVNNLGDAIRKPLVPLPGGSSDAPITDDEWRFVMDSKPDPGVFGLSCRRPAFHREAHGTGNQHQRLRRS